MMTNEEILKLCLQLGTPVVVAILGWLIKSWLNGLKEQVASLVASIDQIENWRLSYTARNEERMRDMRRRLQKIERWVERNSDSSGVG